MRDGRSVRVDLDSIYWADEVSRPGRLRCAGLAFTTGLLVGLVDFVAAGAMLVRRFPDPDAYGWWSGHRFFVDLVRYLAQVAGLLIRALVTPFLAVLGATAALTRYGQRRLGDALAWGGDELSRVRVREHVRRRVMRRPDGPLVMVGHSQGGAVLASIEPEMGRAHRDLRLVTLGTGNALLAAIDVFRPSWSPWRSAALWLPTMIFAAGTALGLLVTLLAGLPGLMEAVASVGRVGGGLWLMDDSPEYADELIAEAHQDMMVGIIEELEDGNQVPVGWAATFGMIGGATLLIGMLLVGTRAEELIHRVRTAAKGIDIVARHDIVSSAMLALGEEERLSPVRQCDSLLDHVTYFENGAATLPLIVGEIESAAGFRVPDQPLVAAYHATGLTVRRRSGRWVAVFAAIIVTGVAAGSLWTVGGLVAALVTYGVVTLLTTATTLRWLRRATRLSAEAPQDAAERENARQRRRSVWWTAALYVIAYPLVAGALVAELEPPPDFGPEELAALQETSAIAFSVGLGLVVAARFCGYGFWRADIAAVVCLLLVAAVWFGEATAWSATGGTFALGAVLWGVGRLKWLPRRRAA
ncbi:MAG TPA: hypothetical protein VNO82_08690 [Solirubrobacteraceae bacterium]|nr:hypothetical protein [Solirubrobacteraceae bacterium]